jgi:hypothetical protein
MDTHVISNEQNQQRGDRRSEWHYRVVRTLKALNAQRKIKKQKKAVRNTSPPYTYTPTCMASHHINLLTRYVPCILLAASVTEASDKM